MNINLFSLMKQLRNHNLGKQLRPFLLCSLYWITPGIHAEAASPNPDSGQDKVALEKAASGKWQSVFSDPCNEDWRQHWFLDGEVGTVQNGPEGMTLTAGLEFKTRPTTWFCGRSRASRETSESSMNTPEPTMNRAVSTSSIFKRLAGEKSRIPRTLRNGTNSARCLRWQPTSTTCMPITSVMLPFQPLRLRNLRLPAITEGRVGLRHMFTRSARYRNFQISTLQTKTAEGTP